MSSSENLTAGAEEEKAVELVAVDDGSFVPVRASDEDLDDDEDDDENRRSPSSIAVVAAAAVTNVRMKRKRASTLRRDSVDDEDVPADVLMRENAQKWSLGAKVKFVVDLALVLFIVGSIVSAAANLEQRDTRTKATVSVPTTVLRVTTVFGEACNATDSSAQQVEMSCMANSVAPSVFSNASASPNETAQVRAGDSRRLCRTTEHVTVNLAEYAPCVSGTTNTIDDTHKLLLSLVPFVIVFQGILSFKFSSRHVAPLALVVTSILGLTFFQDADEFENDALAEATGKVVLVVIDRMFWTIFSYAINVAAAFFLLRVCQLWGIVERMRTEFEKLAPNDNRKILLVGFCFAIVLGVVAPAGSNFVIAGSVLISMNLLELPENDERRLAGNKRIAALALFGNALTSAFNLLGVCITTIAEDIGPLEEQATRHGLEQTEHASLEIGRLFSEQFLLLATLSPTIMCYIWSEQSGFVSKIAAMRADLPILLSTGFLYGCVQIAVAGFIGPQLPCLIAGAVAMLFYLLVEKRRSLRCALPSWSDIKRRQYLLPLGLLLFVLLFIGVVPGVENALKGGRSNAAWQRALNPYVLKIDSGGVKHERRFAWLSHSSTIVFAIGLLTPYLVRYTKPTLETTATAPGVDAPFTESTVRDGNRFKRTVKRIIKRLNSIYVWKRSLSTHRRMVIGIAFTEAIKDVLPVLFSITSFASIAKLMGQFEMTQQIAQSIVDVLDGTPALYAVFMPIIGALGSALTGSTTTSNFLFGRLQVNTARKLGLINELTGRNSVFEVGAAQVLGATTGEIISPMNAVVITVMQGVGGGEASLIRRLLFVAMLWMAATMAISTAFIAPTDGGLD